MKQQGVLKIAYGVFYLECMHLYDLQKKNVSNALCVTSEFCRDYVSNC
jgi:hypothetical protein